jgi:hypothetical protein
VIHAAARFVALIALVMLVWLAIRGPSEVLTWAWLVGTVAGASAVALADWLLFRRWRRRR